MFGSKSNSNESMPLMVLQRPNEDTDTIYTRVKRLKNRKKVSDLNCNSVKSENIELSSLSSTKNLSSSSGVSPSLLTTLFFHIGASVSVI